MELRRDISDFDRLKSEAKKMEKKHREELIALKEKNSNLEIKISEIILEKQYFKKKREEEGRESYETSYFGYQ